MSVVVSGLGNTAFWPFGAKTPNSTFRKRQLSQIVCYSVRPFPPPCPDAVCPGRSRPPAERQRTKLRSAHPRRVRGSRPLRAAPGPPSGSGIPCCCAAPTIVSPSNDKECAPCGAAASPHKGRGSARGVGALGAVPGAVCPAARRVRLVRPFRLLACFAARAAWPGGRAWPRAGRASGRLMHPGTAPSAPASRAPWPRFPPWPSSSGRRFARCRRPCIFMTMSQAL